MPQEFNYKSTIKDVQSRLVSQSIRDTANVDFLKSEESLSEVIKSYQDRFKSVEGMLFDATRYVAKSANIIRVEDFNEMFESIFIDLVALYNDLDMVDRILKLNLGRNKNYFLIIKKRLRDLWHKLHLTRLLIYDENPSDESYYESFFTKINAKKLQNAAVDKKSGFLHLAPEFTKVHNLSSVVKNVTATTYPEHNDNGGIRYTSSNLNSFEENYTNGERDMLENGLWKEQILCNEIPDFNLNIGSSTIPINRTYKGVTSIIDIDFVYPVDVNRLDFDVFGELTTKIDAILYKPTSDANWDILTFVNPNRSPVEDEYGEKLRSVKGNAFDILALYNITKVAAKHLRIVLNQENYVFLDTKSIDEKTVDEKIQDDLSERRYEVIKFGSDIDDLVSKPTNDENQSLYYKLISIIESTTNIEEILDKIDDILNPKINVVSYNYERTAKFEIGAWSIEPKIETYTQAIGKFDSMAYKLPDRPLTSVSLVTKQETPKSTTANWFVNIGDRNIPVVENNKTIRTEPLYAIDMTSYASLSTWTNGTFFLLDCPLSSVSYDDIYISVNGGVFNRVSLYGNIVYLNSRLIYIDAISDPFEALYTIQYPVEIQGSVNLYVPIALAGDSPQEVVLDIVSSRYEVLKAFIEEEKWVAITQKGDTNETIFLKDQFGIASAVATITEAKLWFGDDFNSCVFVGDKVKDYFDINTGLSSYSEIITGGESKSSISYSDVSTYVNGTSSVGYSDLTLIGSLPNIAPISQLRSI